MRRSFAVALVLAAGLLVPAAARAHFILMAPDNWATQDTSGNPQKSAPCGQTDPGVVASGRVTALAQGATVTITISETIAHPGHYSVALSTTGQAGLPADPTVTPVGADQCGSKAIMNPPVFPVIADGMLPHTSAFSGPQTFTVKLPDNVTCNANCVLQVTEYMQAHGAPCFYHHCADVVILPPDGTGAGGTTGAGGSTGQGGAGGTGTGTGGAGGTDDSGCGCAVGRTSGSALGALAMVLVVTARRRIRSPNRPPGRRTGS